MILLPVVLLLLKLKYNGLKYYYYCSFSLNYLCYLFADFQIFFILSTFIYFICYAYICINNAISNLLLVLSFNTQLRSSIFLMLKVYVKLQIVVVDKIILAFLFPYSQNNLNQYLFLLNIILSLIIFGKGFTINDVHLIFINKTLNFSLSFVIMFIKIYITFHRFISNGNYYSKIKALFTTFLLFSCINNYKL